MSTEVISLTGTKECLIIAMCEHVASRLAVCLSLYRSCHPINIQILQLSYKFTICPFFPMATKLYMRTLVAIQLFPRFLWRKNGVQLQCDECNHALKKGHVSHTITV